MTHTAGDPFRLPRASLATIVALALLQAASLIAFLLLMRHIVDGLGGGPAGAAGVRGSIAVLAAVALANAALRWAEFSVSEKMGYEVVRRLRLAMYAHLQGMTPRQAQRRSRGGLLLRFTGDLSMLRTWISRGIARGLVSLILVVAGLGIVGVLNVRLALVIGAVLSFGLAASARLGPRLERVTRAARRNRSLLTSNIDEQVSSLSVVQVFGRSGGELARLSRQNDSMTSSLFDGASVRAQMIGIAAAAGWLATVAVLYVGSVDVAAGRTGVGEVVVAVIATRQLTGPVRRLGLSYDYWKRGQVSRRKVRELLSSAVRPLDEPGTESLRVRRGQIELRDVSVEGSLTHVTQEIGGGQVVAVVGPPGAGKSTLLALVSGLLDPDGGEILVDGHQLAERTLRSRFQQIGMVAPDLPLMRGTVRRSLTYRKPSASDAEVHRVVQACHLDEVIDRLPHGLDTWLNEEARNLSVGQRQRVALARALMGNPPILLLDEPTVNLDEAGKEVFRRVIAHHHGTVLLVTNDAREAGLADLVWFMDGGRVVDVTTGDDYRDRQWAGRRSADAHRR
jgi:ATP-binding cassette, subfamily B, bacterial